MRLNSIIDSHPFKVVLRYAKAHVLQERRTQITVQDFLTGSLMAHNNWEDIELERATIAGLHELQSQKHLRTSTTDKGTLRKTDEQLRVCSSLRKLLSKDADLQTLDQLIQKCIASFEEDMKHDEALICFGYPNHHVMRELWMICSVIKSRTEQPSLDADIIAVSLKIASESGVLANHPLVRAKIEGHRSDISCIEKDRGWANLHETIDCSADEPERLTLAGDLRQSLKDNEKNDDPLLCVVNIALSAAQKSGELERTAYHEAGHAVASLILRPDVKIIELSIVSQSDSAGRVAFEEIALHRQRCSSREDIHHELLISLAGRVAEQKKFGFGAADAGASHDLKQATTRLWTAITEYGFDPEFGPISLPALSELTSNPALWLHDEAQKRLQQLLKIAHDECVQLIDRHWEAVELLACALFKHKSLSEDTISKTCAVPNLSLVMHRSASQPTIFSHGISS
jgi:hypothetical protein